MALPNGYSELAVAEAFDPTILELIILPTEKCNFRCTYCYEDFAIGAMKPAIVRSLKTFISRRMPSIRALSLSWFGGEPLLAKHVIADVGTHAHDLANQLGIDFSGGLTTNGYLLDEATLLNLHTIRHRHFQITLDGPRDAHNLTRRRADGRGTFDQIWQNLQIIHRSQLDVEVLLRIHVGPTNTDKLPELIELINGAFGTDNRFMVHFHRISELGGPNASQFQTLSSQDYERALWQLKTQLRLPSNSEVEKVSQKAICYAAKLNSLLIRADGRLGKCTVALNDPRNDVGRLLEDGRLEINDKHLRLWMNGFTDFDEGALGCPLSNLSERTEPESRKSRIDALLLA